MSQIYHYSFTEIFANNFAIKEFSLQLKFDSFIMLSKSHNLGNIDAGGLNPHSNDHMLKKKIICLKERPQNLNKQYNIYFFISYSETFTIFIFTTPAFLYFFI